MAEFDIVAHRGIPIEAPENTPSSFRRAVELGADAVEMDVRLTADRVPVVYHYSYLDEYTTGRGAIFAHTLEQLRGVRVRCKPNPDAAEDCIPTLDEILAQFGDRIGLEIEIKGPEPEAPALVGEVLKKYTPHWPSIEVTSFEPALLREMQKACPGMAVDLLLPGSLSWMKPDVIAYEAIHRARLAGARAVHLHASQLSADIIEPIRSRGILIHVWDVNDRESLEKAAALGVPRICTDYCKQAMDFRASSR